MHRYLFKKALVEDDIAMQEAMEKRETKEKQMLESDLKWEQGKTKYFLPRNFIVLVLPSQYYVFTNYIRPATHFIDQT